MLPVSHIARTVLDFVTLIIKPLWQIVRLSFIKLMIGLIMFSNSPNVQCFHISRGERLLASSRLCVRLSSGVSAAVIALTFVKFGIGTFYENLSRK